MDEKDFTAFLDAALAARVDLTLPEILALKNDSAFVDEIIIYVCDRVTARHELTRAERVVHLVADCEYRLLRSGLSDPLSATDRDAMIAALTQVGAVRVAEILRRAAVVFDASPDALQSFEVELGPSTGASEIRRCLEKWIATHRALFALD